MRPMTTNDITQDKMLNRLLDVLVYGVLIGAILITLSTCGGDPALAIP